MTTQENDELTTVQRLAIKGAMHLVPSPVKSILKNCLEDGKLNPRLRNLARVLESNDRGAGLRLVQSFSEDTSLRFLMSRDAAGELDADRLKLVMQLYRGDFDENRLKLVLQLCRGEFDENRLKLVMQLCRGDFDESRLKFAIRLLRSAPYMEDLFATLATANTWLEDERFQRAYNAGSAISAWGHDIRWRAYTLMKCAELARDIKGDFVECGVDRGGTAMCVIEYIGRKAFTDRLFYLFDTYTGVVEDQMSTVEADMSRLPNTRYPDVYEKVVETYANMPFAKILRGRVPETLTEFKPGPVAYLHIDMNVAVPECAALEFYWPYLSKGAPVIFDDYGFPYHAPQKSELDKLAKKLGTSIMMLPSGQGLLWK
ncbi:MAG: TylF/MycF family methyltransferase [Alphaproteobacteria bacterium]|nr:TylF/MycF family methyltransferase [Alphaproteobacteria bacterium]